MMKRLEMKALVERRFRECGFEKLGATLSARRDGVGILIGCSTGFNGETNVSVGFKLLDLGEMPARVERSDVVIRLERLFPPLRELVLTAGDLADPNSEAALERLDAELSNSLCAEILALGYLPELTKAYESGRFESALVRAEARTLLAAK